MVIRNTYISGVSLSRMVEIIWILVPMLIVVVLAVPSINILYYLDEGWRSSLVTIKVTGHQWY